VFVGRCYDLTETPPYGPWIELFGRYRQEDGMPPLPDAFAERGTVSEVTSQAALFRQVLDFLTAIGVSRPVLLLLDDLHWADPASLDLLRFIARSIDTLPLLLIVTYRSDELMRRHPLYALLPLLVRESNAARLDLARLSDIALNELVAARYVLSEADHARLVSYLRVHADGNTLFTVEILRSLEELGVLHHVDDDWHVGDLSILAVPPLVQQMIDGRVARLGEEAQRLLAIAAVIGHEILLAVWATVTQTDDDALLDLAERAVAAGLMEAASTEDAVRFRHALIREALYESITPLRRRRLHRQVGEALISNPHVDPDAVAFHFQQAGDDRAAEWLVKAGERAQRAYAWLTAADRYEAALDRMEDSSANAGIRGWLHYRLAVLRRFDNSTGNLEQLDEAAALASVIDDRVLAAHIQYYRGLMRLGAHDAHRMLDELAAGVAALESLTSSERKQSGRFDLVDAHAARGTLMLRLARVGRYGEVIGMRQQWVAAAPADPTRVGDRGAVPDGFYGLGIAFAHYGQVEAAIQAFAQARALCEATQHFPVLGGVLTDMLKCVVLPYRADDLIERRQLAEAANVSWERAREMGSTYPARWSYTSLQLLEGGWDEAGVLGAALAVYRRPDYAAKAHSSAILVRIAFARGDGELLNTLIRERLRDGPETEPGTIYCDLTLQQVAAQWEIEAGNLSAARTWLEAHDRWLAWNGAVLGQSAGQALWAQYYRRAGDSARAREHAKRALQYATEPRQPLALLAAHRVLGELATDAASYDDARAHLETSRALASACAALYEGALTLLAMAELQAAMPYVHEARQLLTEARAIFEPLDAKPALARADALDSRLGVTAKESPVYPAGLSAREVEVLRLLAVGETNRQIADALFLSEHTVRVHVRNILTKTNTENRTAAAAFARDRSLA
jgi:DNA-binding CsgD family transcriptional regulator